MSTFGNHPSATRTANAPGARRAPAAAITLLAFGFLPTITASPAAADPLVCPPTPFATPGPMMLPVLADSDTVTPGITLHGAAQGKDEIERVTWFRDGVEISMPPLDPRDQYTVTVDDIGTRIQQVAHVVHTDPNPCYNWSTGAASPPVAVKAGSTLKLRASDPQSTKPPRVTIKITQQGAEPVRGFVTITWKGPKKGSKVVRVAKPSGTAINATLPSLGAGSYRLQAAFTDTSGRAMPSAGGTDLRVRK